MCKRLRGGKTVDRKQLSPLAEISWVRPVTRAWSWISFSYERHRVSFKKKKKLEYWEKLAEVSLFCGAFNKRLDNSLEDKWQQNAKTSCGIQYQGNWMKSDGPRCMGAQTRRFITSPCLKLSEFRKFKAENKWLVERCLLCSSRTFYVSS